MEDKLAAVLAKTWELVQSIEPARGQVLAQQVLEVRTALDQMAAEIAQARKTAALEGDAATDVDGKMATIYARAAAVAIAAGDESNAARWLIEAERLSRDDDQRAVIAAARGSYERYRTLVHGRNLFARDRESAARKLWAQLARGEPDAISRAATAELDAPRPLRPGDEAPTLSRINGIGAAFYGRRDTWPDGSYATTHCISILWIPVLPLSAWRVRDAGGGYQIFAREQLSSFARLMRWAVPAAVVLAIAVYATTAYLSSPARLAKQRWDEALEIAQRGDPEPAVRALDGELARDVSLVDAERAERAGAEIVRLTSDYVAKPFTADKLDQAIRVVRRYQGLPHSAQSGAAQIAMLDRLDGWVQQLGDRVETTEQRLALLRSASEIAHAERRAQLDAQITATQLALATSKQADWPLDALAILVGPGGRAAAGAALERADQIVERLCESPSLLVDAGADLDAWAAATQSNDLRKKANALRATALSDRADAEADGVTPKQLAEMQARHPLDQFVALQIARNEASAGDVERAAARLTALGAPGMTIRSARLALAQIAAGQGKLEAADAQLATLLGARLQRFTAASAALQDAVKVAQARIKNALDTGNVPYSLRTRYEAASESERSGVVTSWIDEEMKNDSGIQAARAKYVALGDVVPVALTAGTVKLRRAQKMSGAARDAMLQDAERAFLAIRNEAEGQPSFRLSLGEIYARLGKTKESDAELDAVLANHDPELTLQVAALYRAIGSIARAKQIANELYPTASSPHKESAASLLGLMSEDEEAEGWYRKANQKSPFVQAALLEIEARRLQREGKNAECAAKHTAAAKLELSKTGTDVTGYNNAALAYERSFDCNGDPQALKDADAALETAYRRSPEDPIVVANLTFVLRSNGRIRVLGRHIDVRALQLRLAEVDELVDELLDGPERATLLAELAADPSLRRSRELLAQAEILMPNQPAAYAARFSEARDRRDVAEAEAIVDRVRHAKALDNSEAKASRDRWRSGADDAKRLAEPEGTRARLEPVLTRAGTRLDPKTRAAGWYVLARALTFLGIYKADRAALAAARQAAATAMRFWPALDGDSLIIAALVDEAALGADARSWVTARRTYSVMAALEQLVADRSPVADKIRATPQWAEVAAHTKRVTIPTLSDVRLARLLGDAALEARARPVFDDKLYRLKLELTLLVDPEDQAAKQDLAYLDRR